MIVSAILSLDFVHMQSTWSMEEGDEAADLLEPAGPKLVEFFG